MTPSLVPMNKVLSYFEITVCLRISLSRGITFTWRPGPLGPAALFDEAEVAPGPRARPSRPKLIRQPTRSCGLDESPRAGLCPPALPATSAFVHRTSRGSWRTRRSGEDRAWPGSRSWRRAEQAGRGPSPPRPQRNVLSPSPASSQPGCPTQHPPLSRRRRGASCGRAPLTASVGQRRVTLF